VKPKKIAGLLRNGLPTAQTLSIRPGDLGTSRWQLFYQVTSVSRRYGRGVECLFLAPAEVSVGAWDFRSLGEHRKLLALARFDANDPDLLFCHHKVESGDFITTSGIYRMNDHPGREIALIYGDAVPTFQGKKVAFRLIRAAKNPRRG
jgi:hypothetical protein